MSTNNKRTSADVASLASKVLQDKGASDLAHQLAGSALSQRLSGRQTGAELEQLASRALRDGRSSEATKDLAASILSQSNRER